MRHHHHLVEVGTFNGHRFQASETLHAFIIDGGEVLTCTPLEYHVALRLLHAPGHPLPAHALMTGDDRLALRAELRSWRDVIAALRKKLAPFGIEILRLTRFGYVLHIREEIPHAK